MFKLFKNIKSSNQRLSNHTKQGTQLMVMTRNQSTYKMRSALLQENRLVMSNDDFDEARHAGFFEINTPENLRHHMDNMRNFSKEFYKDKNHDGSIDDHYRGFNLKFNQTHPFAADAPEEGYMVDNHKGLADTNDNQVERFSLKKAPPNINHWKDFYPNEIASAAEMMNRIAILVMVMTMQKMEIDQSLWAQATGKSIDDQGAHYLLFNHYRSEIDARGVKAHQDWSNVTVLCNDENENERHALEAYIDGQWQAISPKDSHHLIVNFGLTLEILTQSLKEAEKINGSVHRVIQQSSVRNSSVLFADHSFTSPICTLSPDKKSLQVVHDDFSEFVIEASKTTYDGVDDKWDDSNQVSPQPGK